MARYLYTRHEQLSEHTLKVCEDFAEVMNQFKEDVIEGHYTDNDIEVFEISGHITGELVKLRTMGWINNV